jgi:HEAT repeat protein
MSSLSQHAAHCPECGRSVSHTRQLTRTRRRWRWAALAAVLIILGPAWPLSRDISRDDIYSVLPTRVLWRMHFSDRWINDRKLMSELSFRRAALGGISKSDQRWVVGRCIGLVDTSHDPVKRVNAVLLLAWIGGRDARITPAMLRWIDDPDAMVQARVIRALGIYRADGATVIPRLIRIAGDRSARGADRTEAIDILANYGSQAQAALPTAIGMTMEADADIRRAAARSIGWFDPDPEQVLPTLLQLLKNAQMPEDYDAVLTSIGLLGPAAAGAVHHLTPLLLLPEPGVKSSCIQALLRIGDATSMARAKLRELADDPSAGSMADLALIALIVLDDPRTPAETLGDLLTAPPSLRPLAARELVDLRHKAAPAVPQLVLALDDPNGSVRNRAAMALCNIGPPADAAVPRLRDHVQQNPIAEVALQQIFRRETEPFMENEHGRARRPR